MPCFTRGLLLGCRGLLRGLGREFGGVDADPLAVAVDRLELHLAVDQGIDRVVLAEPDVLARVDLGPPLAHDDRARLDQLSPVALDAEHLRVAVATVPGTTNALLV